MRRRILLDYLMSMLPVGSMLLVGCAGLSKKGGAANDDTLSVMGRWTTEMPADSAAERGIELKAGGGGARGQRLGRSRMGARPDRRDPQLHRRPQALGDFAGAGGGRTARGGRRGGSRDQGQPMNGRTRIEMTH